MNHSKIQKPKILLVGCGNFGKNHLRNLLNLEKEGKVIVKGVVTKTITSGERITREFKVNTYQTLSPDLLQDVDAVDITTPSETHIELIRKIIPYTHIFVEKPLGLTSGDIQTVIKESEHYGHIVMVGHIFRFNSAVDFLKKILEKEEKKDIVIRAAFINKSADSRESYPKIGALHEFLHLFDILDYIFQKKLLSGHSVVHQRDTFERHVTVNLTYEGNITADLEVGWNGEQKRRDVEIILPGKRIFYCDLLSQKVITPDKKVYDLYSEEPLKKELECFLKAIAAKWGHTELGYKGDYPDGTVALRIQRVIEEIKKNEIIRSSPPSESFDEEQINNNPRKKLKVGIIGGGIFGLTTALELAKFCDVTVFERNKSVLSEATSQNMLRYHSGYHYPRSPETVKEIREASVSFEEEFKECILNDFPAYYAIAKDGSMTTREGFLQFCDENNLPYEIVNPPEWLVDKEKISLCVKTREGIYDPDLLKKLIRDKVKKVNKKNKLKIMLNSEVVHGRIDGRKKFLSVLCNHKTVEQGFDIVINATYSHFNTFNSWFGFKTPVMQYDLMEILEIEIPRTERFGLLILDGLFATILPKGKKHTFTLGHVKHTMLRRVIAETMEDIHKTRNLPSNRDLILKESAKLMPFLKKAKVIQSMYSTRVIKPFHEHDDARPTEITDYGNGIYSIFSGKVVTAVKTAREISARIKKCKD